MRIPVGVLVIGKLASGEVEQTHGGPFIRTWMSLGAPCFECLVVMSEGGLDQPWA